MTDSEKIQFLKGLEENFLATNDNLKSKDSIWALYHHVTNTEYESIDFLMLNHSDIYDSFVRSNEKSFEGLYFGYFNALAIVCDVNRALARYYQGEECKSDESALKALLKASRNYLSLSQYFSVELNYGTDTHGLNSIELNQRDSENYGEILEQINHQLYSELGLKDRR